MESALPLLLFFLFLFGSILLILATGCASRLNEAFQEEPEPPVRLPAAGLIGGPPCASGPTSPLDESALRCVEGYVQNEERHASEFVLDPSPDGLYRRTSFPAKLDDSLFQTIERFLEAEQYRAEDFVANPSIESLFDTSRFGVAVA